MANSIFWFSIILAVCFSSRCNAHQIKESFVAAILFTGPELDQLIVSLHHFDKSLDDNWKIQVFYEEIDLWDLKNEINTRIGHGKSKLTWRFVFSRVGLRLNNRDILNDYMINNFTFWESIVGDRILIFQTDSGICSKTPFQIYHFTQYDYIGAPFPHYHYLFDDDHDGEGEVSEEDTLFHGGNGGFSIRSRRSMLECSRAAANGTFGDNAKGAEDIFFSWCVRHIVPNPVLPHRFAQQTFSVESQLRHPNPFGFHKCWAYLDENSFLLLAKSCPEVLVAKANHVAIDAE